MDNIYIIQHGQHIKPSSLFLVEANNKEMLIKKLMHDESIFKYLQSLYIFSDKREYDYMNNEETSFDNYKRLVERDPHFISLMNEIITKAIDNNWILCKKLSGIRKIQNL